MFAKQFQLNRYYFILGVSNAFAFQFIGTVILAEILLIVLAFRLFIDLSKGHQYISKSVSLRIVSFGGIWFLSQLFTDLYRQIDTTETFKSLSQIFVLTLSLFALLMGNEDQEFKLSSYFIGLNFSYFLLYFFSNSPSDSWKFYFGPAISGILLLLLGFSSKKSFTKVVVILLLASMSLVLGSRSLGLILLITALSYLNISQNRYFFKTIVFILCGVLLGVFANNIYRNAALSGELGETQQRKAQLQYASGPILLTARSEFLYEIAAIKSNPWIGLGSNPNATEETLLKTFLLEQQFRVDSKNTAARGSLLKDGRLPQHSMFFGAWLEGGILALPFWLYLFWQMTKWNMRNNLRNQNAKLSVISKYLYINFVWAFFFSPLGAGSRMMLATSIAICFYSQNGIFKEEVRV